jgi:hypothetical protein
MSSLRRQPLRRPSSRQVQSLHSASSPGDMVTTEPSGVSGQTPHRPQGSTQSRRGWQGAGFAIPPMKEEHIVSSWLPFSSLPQMHISGDGATESVKAGPKG